MLKAISLFTGIGGLDFGFEVAGFTTSVAVELEEACCDMLRANRRWPIIQGDIHEITSRKILRTAGLRQSEVDVLIGGPPCQPFSKSGYWRSGDAGRLDDPRAGTLQEFLRVLQDTRPRAFLLENVRGLAYKSKDEGLQFLLKGIKRVNRRAGTKYNPKVAVLNAADYGVAQVRERVFIIGGRDGQDFIFPKPTHGQVEGQDDAILQPYRTAWDAIGDLEDDDDPELFLGGKWAGLLPSIPEGSNYLFHTRYDGGMPIFGWRRRYWSFLLKLSKRKPSWTIQAESGPATGPFHWNNRRLSILELCRLQTFPDRLRFNCSRLVAQRMIGNAVPSLLAEVLARSIRAQLLESPYRGTLKLLPPRRLRIPARRRIRPVPLEYHRLAGRQADHPGEGKGPGISKLNRLNGLRPPTLDA